MGVANGNVSLTTRGPALVYFSFAICGTQDAVEGGLLDVSVEELKFGKTHLNSSKSLRKSGSTCFRSGSVQDFANKAPPLHLRISIQSATMLRLR